MRTLLLCGLLSASPLLAQTVDTVGGTTTTSSITNNGKGNLYRIDSSVVLLDFEMWLNVNSADTLTFFAYRCPYRTGTAALEWTLPIAVAGGGGYQWYSTGAIALPLLEGNYYLLGVKWTTAVGYNYTTIASAGMTSFGGWERARTTGAALPATLTISGSDSAIYYQRLTSVPLPAVDLIGTGCSATQSVPPRLVASAAPTLGNQLLLSITNAAPSVPGVCLVALGAALPAPVPLFGCSIWANVGAPSINGLVLIDSLGRGDLPLAIPNLPALIGLPVSSQAAVLGPSLDITNAVDLRVY